MTMVTRMMTMLTFAAVVRHPLMTVVMLMLLLLLMRPG
jgi:hypothetical protein